MKIGLITFHHSNNYGALLQAWALQTVLTRLGCDVEILNRVPTPPDRNPGFLAAGKAGLNRYFTGAFQQFRDAALRLSGPPLLSEADLRMQASGYELIITGSDQVWRPDYTRTLWANYFLDFVPENVARVSYAASFGTDDFKGDSQQTVTAGALLNRFDALSVREDTGKALCKVLSGREAVHVVDPTLLLKPADYMEVPGPLWQQNSPYLASYILDPNPGIDGFIRNVAGKAGLPVVKMGRRANREFSVKKLDFRFTDFRYDPVSFWVHKIRQASVVVTDSFHGAVFSILFNKPFLCFGNAARGMTRFQSLFKKFGVENRLLETASLDWRSAPAVLPLPPETSVLVEKEREHSMRFLTGALTPKVPR